MWILFFRRRSGSSAMQINSSALPSPTSVQKSPAPTRRCATAPATSSSGTLPMAWPRPSSRVRQSNNMRCRMAARALPDRTTCDDGIQTRPKRKSMPLTLVNAAAGSKRVTSSWKILAMRFVDLHGRIKGQTGVTKERLAQCNDLACICLLWRVVSLLG